MEDKCLTKTKDENSLKSIPKKNEIMQFKLQLRKKSIIKTQNFNNTGSLLSKNKENEN